MWIHHTFLKCSNSNGRRVGVGFHRDSIFQKRGIGEKGRVPHPRNLYQFCLHQTFFLKLHIKNWITIELASQIFWEHVKKKAPTTLKSMLRASIFLSRISSSLYFDLFSYLLISVTESQPYRTIYGIMLTAMRT